MNIPDKLQKIHWLMVLSALETSLSKSELTDWFRQKYTLIALAKNDSPGGVSSTDFSMITLPSEGIDCALLHSSTLTSKKQVRNCEVETKISF